MNNFERQIMGSIPHGEAAAFFVKLKTASASYAPPDETGALEGQFEAPIEQVLQVMSAMVENEFKTQLAYRVYANSLRDLSHHSIAEEFEQHADDEVDHADFVLRRMAVLGGAVHLNDIPAPPPLTDAQEIIRTMIRMEQEGIARWKTLHAMLGDNPTKYKVEEYLTREQEHLDELWQLLPREERQAILTEGPSPKLATAAPATPGAFTTGLKNFVKGMNNEFVESSIGTAARTTAAHAKDGLSGAAGNVAGAILPTAVIGASSYLHGKSRGRKQGQEEAMKTAGVAIEHHHPETLRYHGAAMKLALASMKPTVFVPEVTLEGEYKTASAPLAKLAQNMKRAFDELAQQTGEMPGEPSAALDVNPAASGMPMGAEPALDPETAAYVQQEQAAQQATDAAEAAHYKEQFQQAQQQLQMLQQQQQQNQEQLQSLQQQTQAAQSQIDSAMQQSQVMQQQALNNIQQANANATQAMQQSMALQTELGQQQQLSTSMRMAYEKIRQQAAQMATEQPPPALTPAAEQQSQMAAQMQQQSAPPQSPNPAAMMQQQAQPPGPEGQSPPAQGQPKMAAMDIRSKIPNLIGAAAGAALMGGATHYDSKHSDLEGLRSKIKKLENQPGGFGKSLELAAQKARLSFSEAVEKHPTEATIMGSVLGATMGYGAPSLKKPIVDVWESGRNLKDTAVHLAKKK